MRPKRALFGLVLLAACGGGEAKEVRRAFLEEHCTSCHNAKRRKGDLDLDVPLVPPETLRRARERVALGEMPPKGRTRPPRAEVERFLAAVEAGLPKASADPGRVTLRRLNRAEYENTVRDLLGVEFRASEEFPADDVGYGFDNVGDVLSMPPILLEKYVAAAEGIAGRAGLGDDPARPPERILEGAQLRATGGASPRKGAQVLSSAGSVGASFDLPRDGEYLVRVTAFGQQAGPEPCRMAILLDRKEAARIEVPATEPAPYETRFRAAGGARHVAVAFLNDYYRPDAPDPRQRDRNLVVVSLAVAGPLDPPPAGEFQRTLPAGASPRGTVAHLLRLAFRRPPAAEEVDRFLALAEAEGMRSALVAALASPQFLFRFEEEPPPGEVRALSDHELAARLSYFLWSSMPDAELRDRADRGALREELPRQARRMLRDARSAALAENFAAQWLQIRALDRAAPDTARFPAFDGALREAMREEALLLFEAVLREDRDVRELLDADFTFLNERLARHYGIPGVRGERMRRVKLPPGARGGVLTLAATLLVTSNPTRTSPVKRGKWILETLLASPPPPPPPGAGNLDESPAAALAAPLRERMERHRADPECAVCHDILDPLGFGLENFDAVGAWRSADGAFPLDTRGTLPDGRSFSGPGELKAILREDPRFVRALLEKLLVYALGRGIEPFDAPAIDAAVAALPGRSPAISDIIEAIVGMDAFRKRRGEER